MNEEKQETVADIVAVMRDESHAGDGCFLEWVGDKMRSYADRIEAAANRQFREVTKMISHEEVDVSKMETTTPTSEKSSVVGNAAAMREALEAAIPIMRACLFDYYNTTDVNKVVGEMKAALAKQPRNCDVGTAEEQEKRYLALCDSNNCSSCPVRFKGKTDCVFTWEQMPYEEEKE